MGGFRYLDYLNNWAAGKGSVKTIDLCDQKTAPLTPKSLFTIDAHIPKLDVAGSSPVSRSIFNNLQTLRNPYTLH
jgi:hypothetical protein